MLTIVLHLPTVFNAVICCTGLWPRSNRPHYTAYVCGRLYHPGWCEYTLMFTPRWNHLRRRLSECIPVVKLLVIIWEGCIGFVQILQYFISRTWAYTDFGILGDPGTNPPWILRDDGISQANLYLMILAISCIFFYLIQLIGMTEKCSLVFHLGWYFILAAWVSGMEKELWWFWDNFLISPKSDSHGDVSLFFEVL